MSMPKPKCELCEPSGEQEYAIDQVDGTWMCGVCLRIYKEAKEQGMDIRQESPSRLAAIDKASEPIVIPRRTIDPESLVENLSFVLDAVLGGSISIEQARMACALSSEILKALELKNRLKGKP